jgi:hypothetical protein
VLEGGLEGRPDNVLFYATSNRRHLLPRDMMENERSTAINPGEAVEEKVSLSDRFGLWIGFHRCSQDDYLAMVEGYAKRFALDASPDALRAEALEWATTRGARSGRVAWQFVQDVAGRLGRRSASPSSPERRPRRMRRAGPERRAASAATCEPWLLRSGKPAPTRPRSNPCATTPSSAASRARPATTS